MKTQSPGKGPKAEEALRIYFASLGYFVVRGVPFVYGGFSVSDIDLWLYIKASSFTRERINVDVKRKRTPQAMERIFWAKGLQQVLGLDRCVVATTDKRKETREFGASHAVTVLDGNFLRLVEEHYKTVSDRISEEAFHKEIEGESVLKPGLSWLNFHKEIKQVLISTLDFNGCNLLAKRIRFLTEELLASAPSKKSALRLLYVSLSYFLIALDYTSRSLAQLDPSSRKADLAEGFRYGVAGKKAAKEVLDTAMRIVIGLSKDDAFSHARVEDEIRHQLSSYPAEVLAEYFAKPDTMKNLFSLARDLDQLAYSPDLRSLNELDTPIKSLFGLFCDFFGFDRKRLL